MISFELSQLEKSILPPLLSDSTVVWVSPSFQPQISGCAVFDALNSRCWSLMNHSLSLLLLHGRQHPLLEDF